MTDKTFEDAVPNLAVTNLASAIDLLAIQSELLGEANTRGDPIEIADLQSEQDAARANLISIYEAKIATVERARIDSAVEVNKNLLSLSDANARLTEQVRELREMLARVPTITGIPLDHHARSVLAATEPKT